MYKSSPEHELARRAPKLAAKLLRGSIRFRVIPAESEEATALVGWIETRFPLVGEKILWAEVPHHRCVPWNDTSDLIDSFSRLVRDLDKNQEVHVTWSDGSCPSLAIRLGDLLGIAGDVFEADFDTWIVSQNENWCMEAHHDGTLCLGRTSAVTARVFPS